MPDLRLDSIETVLGILREGRGIVVVDDEDRENEGDVVFAAELVRADDVNFMAREARGLVCIAMAGEDLDRLGLPMMVEAMGGDGRYSSPFTVSVEARTGVTTGISAADRARTARVLADPVSGRQDVRTPGHLFPLRARPEGVLGRRGHTEAGVDLMRLAGLRPAAVICEIMNDDGSMARREDIALFATRHDMPVVSIADLVRHRLALEAGDGSSVPTGGDESAAVVTAVATARIPTAGGLFRATAYRDGRGSEHLVLERDGDPAPTRTAPLVRLHSECLTGDVLGSLRCDCGDQLGDALDRLAREPGAMLLYLRQEGRGIGLANKIRAYALQDEGLDTVEANLCLGFEPDDRDYAVAAAILRRRGIDAVRLLTNNPGKIEGLEASGIRVAERVPLVASARPENERYLRTKASRLRHLLDTDPH